MLTVTPYHAYTQQKTQCHVRIEVDFEEQMLVAKIYSHAETQGHTAVKDKTEELNPLPTHVCLIPCLNCFGHSLKPYI